MSSPLRSCAVIQPGAEAWSSPGFGPSAQLGVVLVHGFTGNPTSTRPLGETLSQRGWAVEVLRLPGHGTCWQDMAQTRYSHWRDEVARGCERMARSCEQVVLVGLSLGGALALDVACDGGRKLRAVCTINAPLLDRPGVLAKLAPWIARVVPAVPASAAGLKKNDAAKPGVDERAYKWVPTQAAQSVIEALPLLRARLPGLRLPVLVVSSRQDHSVAPQNSEAIATLLGRWAKPLRLERSYHLVTLDYDAPVLETELCAFIAATLAENTTKS